MRDKAMVRKLIPGILAAASVGCTGMNEQACLVSDWRTVGFEDGVAGRSVSSIGSYRQACARHGIAPNLASYRAGHAEGVEVYCRPSRGFDVGRRGGAYRGVCPADLEPEFVAAFESGRHLYELESAVRGIDGRIASNEREQESIRQELADITATIAGGETTAEEGVQLVARAAELGKRHTELASEIDALRGERIGHVAALEDYRRTLAYPD